MDINLQFRGCCFKDQVLLCTLMTNRILQSKQKGIAPRGNKKWARHQEIGLKLVTAVFAKNWQQKPNNSWAVCRRNYTWLSHLPSLSTLPHELESPLYLNHFIITYANLLIWGWVAHLEYCDDSHPLSWLKSRALYNHTVLWVPNPSPTSLP